MKRNATTENVLILIRVRMKVRKGEPNHASDSDGFYL